MSEDYAIRVSNLTKKFGSFTAVDHISFEVHRGEIFGFLGANGAGKTTAMRMLTGLSKPTSGEVWVAGYDVNQEPEAVKKNIGYMSQRFSLYDRLTISENIQFYGKIYGLSNKEIRLRKEQLLSSLGLQEQKDERVARIPIGWKQKLAFSVAILHRPAIVFLDEPTGGVDPIARRSFWELIYEASDSGITVFVTTHYMDEAEYCHRVSIMVDGKIEALDTPEMLKQRFAVQTFDEVFTSIARKAQRSSE